MSTRQIHVFISHSWCYSEHYDTLENWIFGQPASSGQASFDLRNYSVPKTNPIHRVGSARELQNAIFTRIRMSHVIVIPTGMYASYSKWIGKEIDGAAYYEKPILAVDLWARSRWSSRVGEAATARVGWNRAPIIRAIWDLYREFS